MDRCATALTSQLQHRAALDQQGITVNRLRWMGQHTNESTITGAPSGGPR